MPGTSVEGKIASENLIRGITDEKGKVIAEMFLTADVFPIQGKLIGEMALLCIITQTIPPTTSRRQPIGPAVTQWVDQP